MGQTVLSFEDTTRPTHAVPGVVDAAPTRKLPTFVAYPAATSGTDVPIAGGDHPLIVLSHGLTTTAHEFDGVYPDLVAAGYIVATPAFPETTGGAGTDAAVDVFAQPLDVRFVIDQVLAANDDDSSPFFEAIDAKRIGVGGHSLGAVTTLLLMYDPRFVDDRIDAAYEASGSVSLVPGGQYDFTRARPLLAVHGDADPTVPYQAAREIYAAAQAPKWLLTIHGGEHNGFLVPGGLAHDVHETALVAFFDRYVKGDASAEDRLLQAGVAGLTTLEHEP
jgi:predicted dienelactone hydrolase